MSRSAAELRALVRDAGRGAGLPLQNAEDLAAIATPLAAAGEVAGLLVALAPPHAPPRPDTTGQLYLRARVAMDGPAALDTVRAGLGPVRLEEVDAPAVMVMLARAAGVRAIVEGATVTLAPADDGTPLAQPPAHPVPRRAELSDQHLAALGTLAEAMLVPNSEASAQGAGAARSDND